MNKSDTVPVLAEQKANPFGVGRCEICGETADIYPDPPEAAYCYEHCPDHDYETHDRETRCITCNQPAPYDYYDD